MESALGARSETGEPSLLRPPPARVYRGETVIRPSAASFDVQLREFWRYRHLFMALVWRNVRVEFAATRLGSAWAVARPLLLGLVFGLFRNFSGADTRVDEVPYLLYVYSGLLLWFYFTDAAQNSALAIRLDSGLLTKVYYPRLITPCVPMISGLTSLFIGLFPLVVMMAWYGVYPTFAIILLPLALLPSLMLALGLGMVVSSLSITNRDWERVLAFVLTIALWFSPVVYAPDMIPEDLRWVYHLNPMIGPLLGFRASLFYGVSVPYAEWAYALASSLVVLALGIWTFRRTEIRLVDRL
ncbi:MAG: ABC transporter permease [Chloroflexota bacterium]|nr:ABC transporter permease [Chloroflexota bacterium]